MFFKLSIKFPRDNYQTDSSEPYTLLSKIYIYIVFGRQIPYGYRTNIWNIITIVKNKKNTVYTYKL